MTPYDARDTLEGCYNPSSVLREYDMAKVLTKMVTCRLNPAHYKMLRKAAKGMNDRVKAGSGVSVLVQRLILEHLENLRHGGGLFPPDKPRKAKRVTKEKV